MTRAVIRSVTHEVNRLEVAAGVPYGEFRRRYERAVPAFDADRFAELQRAGAPWETVRRATEESAPHGFLRYWGFDVTPLMNLAGDRWNCVEYLMGDHTTAQRMFTRDPAVMLYAPLRTAIYEDADGRTWFAVDQPSTRFASFGDAAIAAVGVELDHRLAALLERLGAPVPEVLGQRE
ncbi:hypothetical protein Airi01_059000 [Actinoallomurus iriomotensis]|uniref:DUF302 domain-containing protein n=1 Tax=Actinoallomurus iriomotensis TaxID=478107 RepID=A0A9W6VMH3_9ACTN|nr:hypothetical protein Airi01_059000 [Actinoallomurus iriomotensis]